MSIISLLYRIGWTSPNMIFEILFFGFHLFVSFYKTLLIPILWFLLQIAT